MYNGLLFWFKISTLHVDTKRNKKHYMTIVTCRYIYPILPVRAILGSRPHFENPSLQWRSKKHKQRMGGREENVIRWGQKIVGEGGISLLLPFMSLLGTSLSGAFSKMRENSLGDGRAEKLNIPLQTVPEISEMLEKTCLKCWTLSLALRYPSCLKRAHKPLKWYWHTTKTNYCCGPDIPLCGCNCAISAQFPFFFRKWPLKITMIRRLLLGDANGELWLWKCIALYIEAFLPL